MKEFIMNTVTFTQELELAQIEIEENAIEEQRLKNSVVVITTQHSENYGAHDWSGEGFCPHYWKNKGGSTYIYKGILTQEQSDKIAECINSSDDYFTESIVNQEETETPQDFYEHWESPAYIYFEDDKVILSETYDSSKIKYVFELYENGLRKLIR
jgi:hypothetical protein